MLIETTSQFPAVHADVLEDCWKKAAAPAEWNLTLEQFGRLLERSVAQRFAGKQAGAGEIGAYLETLHLADLALAGACSAGTPAAWDFFVAQYRPELYRAARAIAGESSGRELADSLYADLYGLKESEGRRNSLFDYFHGRSKLGTWLRAVLAQRQVDEIRRTRRTEPLEATSAGERPESAVDARAASPSNESPDADPERARFIAMLQAAISVIIAALAPRDRLRLAYYYVDELTLAQIGRLLAEHEATVSRKLERTRREIRKRVEAVLRDERKLSEAQVRLCFEYAREEWPFDLTQVLSRRS
jgi:RNA polymerase sigma-70 factor (ECF subfamily)